MAIVFQTDFAWSSDDIERGVIERAGHTLITGPSTPLPAVEIEEMVASVNPEAIMTCWADVSAKAIVRPDRLRIVQRIGVGLDNIAVDAATSRGAWVANVPDYCVGEVADHAIGFLLSWARGVTSFDREVKLGQWDPTAAKLRRVSDLTIGFIGWGRIARATASRLKAFGPRMLVYTPFGEGGGDAAITGLEQLLAESDAVIIHAPLTPESHHMFDDKRISQMKSGAFLINVSRGPLVDNAALLAALENSHLSGAGLDVVEGEPAPPLELIRRPDVIATPHVAFSSGASLAELRRRSAEEVVRVLAGERPLYPCNDPEGRS